MYTEIIKIIEGALKKDVQKVYSYAKLLAENLKKDGEQKLGDKILKTLSEQKQLSPAFQDQLIISPVDQESRLNMADILFPSKEKMELVLSPVLKKAVDNFIDTIKSKNAIHKAGLDISPTLLLYGAPGCGKTSIAHYISQSLEMPLVVTRLDSLISSLLGNTAKNIRKLFDSVSNKPCILFLDEFDAIAKARDDQHELGELKRVINSLLQNIDGFSKDNILIAATNHPVLLDKAVWRRFNYIIEVEKPKAEEITDLLKLYLKSYNNEIIDNEKRLSHISKSLVGLSPSDIKNICHNAIIKSIVTNNNELKSEDLLYNIFLFKNNNNYDDSALVKFLYNNNITQNSIAEYLKISTRQVINNLKNVDNGKKEFTN